LEQVWKKVLERIRKEIPPQDFSLWFQGLKAVSSEGNKLQVQVESELFRERLLQKFQPVLDSVAEEMGYSFQWIVVDGEKKERVDISRPLLHPDLNSRFTFERFVVGPSNAFVHQASLMVCEEPGVRFNPLFIYGSVGLGKTHLLHAIGHRLFQTRPHLRVMYFTAEDFAQEVVSTIRHGTLPELKKKYSRQYDVLLVDDVQFLSHKERTQIEFFHIFNSFCHRDKQVVLTSDSPPQEIPHLEERLRNRFSSGLLADISPPDYDHRLLILEQKMKEMHFSLPREVVEFVAERVERSVRDLEGALNRLYAKARLGGEKITLSFAEQVLSDFIRMEMGSISPEAIVEYVAEFYHLKDRDLLSPTRKRGVVLARNVAIYLIRKITGMSLSQVGSLFSHRDHTTILHSIRNVENCMEKDPSFKKLILHMEKSLRKGR